MYQIVSTREKLLFFYKAYFLKVFFPVVVVVAKAPKQRING